MSTDQIVLVVWEGYSWNTQVICYTVILYAVGHSNQVRTEEESRGYFWLILKNAIVAQIPIELQENITEETNFTNNNTTIAKLVTVY